MSLAAVAPANNGGFCAPLCGMPVIHSSASAAITTNAIMFRWRPGNCVYRKWSRSISGAFDHKLPMVVSGQFEFEGAVPTGPQVPTTLIRM